MKLLVLGGSFNPIHLGHLMLAEEVALEFGYDRVLLVPSFMPPHKSLADDPGAAERLAMTRLATEDDSRFMVDPCEIERGGLSYSYETLGHVARAYSLEGKPGFVLGDDLAPDFGLWHNPAGICERAELIVARRGGGPFTMDYPHRRATNMILPISSSDIRARIAARRPWRRLVPDLVARYICDHGLYGTA